MVNALCSDARRTLSVLRQVRTLTGRGADMSGESSFVVKSRAFLGDSFNSVAARQLLFGVRQLNAIREETTIMVNRSLIPRFGGLTLIIAAGACVATACSTADNVDRETSGDETPIAAASSALNWKEALCKLADAVPSFDIGSFSMDDPTCLFDNWGEELMYLGSGGPGDYAQTIATATYCAIADTGTKTASAVFSTPVGEFGTRSTLRAFARNNQARHIETEHTGSVVVFGVTVPLQYNTTAWDFPTEDQPAQKAKAERDTTVFSVDENGKLVAKHVYTPYTQKLRAQTGYYARRVEQNLSKWTIGGNGSFVIGPVPIEIDVKLKSEEGSNTWNNGMFSPSPARYAKYSYVDKFNLCVEKCTRAGEPFCEIACAGDSGVPTADQISGHELLCAGGCTGDYFADLSDGILPYTGASGGARGKILYWDPITNFTEHGFPGTPPVHGTGEEAYGLLNEPIAKSTEFGLDITARYDAGIASIAVGTSLDFDTRAGAALRSSSNNGIDGSKEQATVGMQLDAETAINLKAWLKLHIDLGLLPDLDFYLDYDLIDRTGNGHRVAPTVTATNIQWNVNRSGANNAPTAACTAFQTPGTDTANPPTKSGWDFIEEVAEANINQLHPCNVKVCTPSSPDSMTGTLTEWNWNKKKQQLTPKPSGSPVGRSCNVCDSTAAMCNAAGEVIAPFASAKPQECGGVGSICGGHSACDTDDDCSAGRETCFRGCCSGPPR